MEDLIILIDGKDSKNLEVFRSVKAQAKLQPSPYAYTKKWFLNHYKAAMESVLNNETKEMQTPFLEIVSK